MRVYFSVALKPADDHANLLSRPLKAVDADYVPLIGDRVYMELKWYRVVSRDFDTDLDFVGKTNLIARVTMEEEAGST